MLWTLEQILVLILALENISPHPHVVGEKYPVSSTVPFSKENAAGFPLRRRA